MKPDLRLQLEARTALASISERDKLFVEDCFHLSTEEVTKCLEAARGDLVLALKFEVSAVPFSQAFLDKLVWEYADSRYVFSRQCSVSESETALSTGCRNATRWARHANLGSCIVMNHTRQDDPTSCSSQLHHSRQMGRLGRFQSCSLRRHTIM